ncbi:hypothetical protein EV1_007685 [Malus domestica]
MHDLSGLHRNKAQVHPNMLKGFRYKSFHNQGPSNPNFFLLGQEIIAELKAIDVSRRQAKVRDSAGNADIIMKLETAEAKLQELQSSVAILGKEVGAARLLLRVNNKD